MRGRNTPPAPLQRGELRCYFLLGNERFEWDVSPLERGFEGCVTVRDVGWVEVFLLLFGEVLSVRF